MPERVAADVSSLAERIRSLGERDTRRVIIGIAGPPGAGKTTLAKGLVERLAGRPDWRDSAAAHVPMDGFHLADAELDRLGRRDRKGAPDTFDAAGYAALLGRIAAGEDVLAPGFERDLDQPIAQSLPVTANTRYVITEGNYLLLDEPGWRAARELCTEIWYCELDDAVRVERLIARHVEFGKPPEVAREWVRRSDEANARLVSARRDLADVIVLMP